ncbi:MAG: UDP-3-O-(3-hydroxymyristoyl)glucosamine N-acyltransferase [Tannerellaceae bacterium]|jgi:UDP-3-O-[3-hydroxymyristoyl] glucosamine N-acyltransferase|nr:UDP-3-O-(3-hydroxymyristoyl)glucosamine N-acyltransferase [Tannerellaceae bacterium]
MEFTARQIADILNGTVEGDPDVKVNNFSKIEEGKPHSLTFLANPKYEHHIYNTGADIILVNEDFIPSAPLKNTLVRVPNAYAALAALLEMAGKLKKEKKGIDPAASIHSSARMGAGCYVGAFACIAENVVLGDGCKIYPHAYIGDDVVLGDNCIVYPHVTIYEGGVIGSGCILHAGSVIGSDGFGFAPEGGQYKKIPQLGNVILEDNVEIGANTTVDRAVMGSTIIHKGVKLDNLVQIAHNVEVGEDTVMAAQSGVSGSVKIGRHCKFGGQSGMAGHITIGNDVSVGAQAGIIGSMDDGQTVLGSPAIEARAFMRSSVIFRRLPEMYRTIDILQSEIEKLKKELINK